MRFLTAGLRGKFIAMYAHVTKLDKSQKKKNKTNLMMHLKLLEK
jgi:hypothetical protein